jgi:hypothetical protein
VVVVVVVVIVVVIVVVVIVVVMPSYFHLAPLPLLLGLPGSSR